MIFWITNENINNKFTFDYSWINMVYTNIVTVSFFFIITIIVFYSINARIDQSINTKWPIITV